MARPAPDEPDAEQDPYNSASDEDFNPQAQDDDDADTSAPSSASASEAETGGKQDARHRPAKKRKADKRKRTAATPAAAGELDSGDEATIKERARLVKRRKVKFAGDGGDEDGEGMGEEYDDEGGEGGFIKTRSQMRVEEKERRPLASTDGSSIDVDALWSSMTAAPIGKKAVQEPANGVAAVSTIKQSEAALSGPPTSPHARSSAGANSRVNAEDVHMADAPEETITIKRTYEFAGETVTEERRVSKHSAEARLYLSSLEGSGSKTTGESPSQPQSSSPTTPGAGNKPLRRPLRRPSRFDPNPAGEVKGLPPELQRRWWQDSKGSRPTILAAVAAKGAENAGGLAATKATKLNTVEKSKLDWVKHVDEEGLQEELDEYGRAKEGYLGRVEFLNRVEGRREEEYRNLKAR